ncbi:gluconate 2-dehydrogenase subunit 3 family protein [Arcicella rosea]|uniref:Gluconate 2-dehydrogenase subunit 3 n=1 Tax=Arcicella rosea TaxID=502909 RepID=A0A841ENR1_9BACT|nr:gluconate 2-dehydrogenase subunit 3 family protein [Arcicella rosea]MBB6002663.1 hypothetical protein [Arcicella rosea]
MNRREVLKNTTLFLGYSLSAGALSELFIACQKEAQLNWQPVFLSNNQANLIAEIAETILPKTETPGAKELGVPQFIDKMLKEMLSEADQKAFVEDLEKFDETCEEANKKPFIECNEQEREAFLLKADKEAGKLPPSAWGITLVAKPDPVAFFRRVKSLTLLGYYTSEKVGKEILSYDPVPGAFIACMPLSEVGNAWNE